MTRRSRVAVMAAVLAVTSIATTAFAQASNTDARCIAAINKGTRRIALAENKAIQQCARDWLRGLAVPAESCAAPNASAAVTNTADKADLKIDASCEGAPPSFGPTDLSSPLLAVDAQLQTLADVFVSTETAMPSGEPYSKQACQSVVLSSVQKCTNVRLKEFEKCKLKGLRDGTIASALDMNACLFDGTGQPTRTRRSAVCAWTSPSSRSRRAARARTSISRTPSPAARAPRRASTSPTASTGASAAGPATC